MYLTLIILKVHKLWSIIISTYMHVYIKLMMARYMYIPGIKLAPYTYWQQQKGAQAVKQWIWEGPKKKLNMGAEYPWSVHIHIISVETYMHQGGHIDTL